MLSEARQKNFEIKKNTPGGCTWSGGVSGTSHTPVYLAPTSLRAVII